MPQFQPKTEAIEQRRAFRRPVLYRLDVTDESNELVGYLVDISLGGMRVRCVPGLEVKDVRQLRIVLPRWMEMFEFLPVPGRFAWCKPFGERRSEGGFVFGDLTGERVARLETLIDKIADAATEDLEL